MKERKDDVLSSVKESTATVNSDELVTKREKIEGIFGERDEGEDIMVDVVSADDHGVTKVDLGGKVGFNGVAEEGSERETGSRDQFVKDVGVVKEVSDDLVETRVKTLEKVKVVVSEEGVKGSVKVGKEVIQENVVTAVASGSDCDQQKSGNGPVVEDSKMASEPSSKELEASGGEIEVRESVQEMADGDHMMDGKTQKETNALNSSKIRESTDGVNNQSSSNEVVNAGTGEDNVHVSTKNTENQAGVDQTKKDSFQSRIESTKNDAQNSGNGDSKMAVESLNSEPQIAMKEKELEKGVTEERVEQPTESLQEVADVDCVINKKIGKDEVLDSKKIPESVADVDCVINEKTGKDEVLDSKKIPESVTTVDEVIVDEGIVNARTDEGAAVHENAENLDQKAEVHQMNKEECSQSIIEVKTDNVPKSEDSKMDDEPPVIKGEISVKDKHDEPEIGLTKETVGQPSDSVQEVAAGDHVMDAKIVKDSEVLNSSKISESSTMASLGLEDVDVVVVDEGLETKNEVDQKVEVDSTTKDENLYATIKPDEVAACGNVDEVTTTKKETNSDLQVSTDGGILVENQSNNVNAVNTEPESFIDKMTPSSEVQTSKVEPATIGGDSSNFQQDQGLNANPSNEGNEITASHVRVPDSRVEVPTTGGPQSYTEHGVLPANSEFSYEERGEDAGMDIDEVLGWKDEMPAVQEGEQKVDPTNISNLEEQETKALDHVSEVSLQQSCYFHSPENEGEFSVSDLVWGKVRSHPWWPGQIFDPSDASEKAMKYYKKDCFLVAYFGDRTFAWNDSTVLKPFRENFSHIEKHMNSEAFNNAVHCALQEVSRRVELGLACSCISRDIYENIKCQIVENSGIKQESSRRHGVNKSASVNSFEPDKLVDYVRLLAKFPYCESDKMELTMAKAQLSSYVRFKGYRQLAEFQLCGDLLEVEQVVIKDETCSEDSSKKRKALDSISDCSEKRPTLQTETVTAKPLFKVGACIQKVASQLTGPKGEPVDQVVGPAVPLQSPGPTDMLSQLYLTAQDPMKGHSFVNTIIPYFNSHRAAVLSKSRLNSSNEARKRKTSNENEPEEFEFDDVNDSYWTDRIIQNYPEENSLQENQNGGGEQHQIVAYEQEKQPVKPTRRSNKKRFFSSNHEIEAKEQSELIERRRQNLATEVLMKFAEGIYFPSEIHLNKMFKRFGPLMESETEVDRQSGRARVVFKRCSDAEVAHSSAGKFNIFGSINVNYELNYTPLISYKPLPLSLGQDQAHAC